MPKSDIATISPLLMVTGLLVPAFASTLVTSRTSHVTFPHNPVCVVTARIFELYLLQALWRRLLVVSR